MNKNILASIIFAAGAFAFFVLALPELNYVSAAREALGTRQSMLVEKQAELGRVGELNNQYEARQSDIDKMMVFLPKQKRIDQIVSSIQQMASQAGLNLTSLTTATSTETGEVGYETIFVGFDVVGQYPSFVNFLRLLEQNLRLYDIFGIIASLTTSSAGGTQNLVDFSVKLNAYNLK